MHDRQVHLYTEYIHFFSISCISGAHLSLPVAVPSSESILTYYSPPFLQKTLFSLQEHRNHVSDMLGRVATFPPPICITPVKAFSLTMLLKLTSSVSAVEGETQCGSCVHPLQ